jgi:hypothetical protein
MLALTLEKLASRTASNNIDVHVYVDSNANLGQVEIIRDRYFPEAFLFSAKPHPPAVSGTWNILNAIKDAANYAEEVYLVEDDVWVFPDFFEWHESQTSDISCGRRMLRYPKFLLYTNPGSRLSRNALDKLLPHINDEYFSDTVKYCERFPAVHSSTLDDGLIRRVVAKEGLSVTFPTTPKCAHVGIPLLDRLDIYHINGTSWDDRLESVRKILAQPVNSDKYAPLWEPYRTS